MAVLEPCVRCGESVEDGAVVCDGCMAQSLDQDRRDALQSIVNALSIQARGESDSGIRYALYWAIAIVRRELDYD